MDEILDFLCGDDCSHILNFNYFLLLFRIGCERLPLGAVPWVDKDKNQVNCPFHPLRLKRPLLFYVCNRQILNLVKVAMEVGKEELMLAISLWFLFAGYGCIFLF